MKTQIRYLLAGALGLLTSLAVVAGGEPDAPKRVKLTFVQPEKFTDIQMSSMNDDKAQAVVFEQLDKHLQKIAKKYLPADQTLAIEISDIDLAGAYEPWRGPRFDDIRFVRDIYPPRIELSYKVLGADGSVVSEGKEKLTDLAYTMRINMPDQEETRHEKELLSDWMRLTFRAKK